MTFNERKKWSDRFLTEIKSILGTVLLNEPPVVEDVQHNTDLVVLQMSNVRIACRVRKHKYLDDYGDQFTIRKKSPNGGESELRKVIAGWGDLFFYGFCDQTETRIEKWIVGDLKVFRVWLVEQLCLKNGVLPGDTRTNSDGTQLIAFDCKKMPSSFVVASNSFQLTEV